MPNQYTAEPPGPEWLNSQEVAEILGLSHQRVNAMTRARMFRSTPPTPAGEPRRQHWYLGSEVYAIKTQRAAKLELHLRRKRKREEWRKRRAASLAREAAAHEEAAATESTPAQESSPTPPAPETDPHPPRQIAQGIVERQPCHGDEAIARVAQVEQDLRTIWQTLHPLVESFNTLAEEMGEQQLRVLRTGDADDLTED